MLNFPNLLQGTHYKNTCFKYRKTNLAQWVQHDIKQNLLIRQGCFYRGCKHTYIANQTEVSEMMGDTKFKDAYVLIVFMGGTRKLTLNLLQVGH
jgi:hypothetical protein